MPLIKHFDCVACLGGKKEKEKRNIFNCVNGPINNEWIIQLRLSVNKSQPGSAEIVPFSLPVIKRKRF